MTISSRRGDRGDTELLFGRRLRKGDVRVAALGAIDELSAALGLVRAFAGRDALGIPGFLDRSGDHGDGEDDLAAAGESGVPVAVFVERVQNALIAAMGQLSVLPSDVARYRESRFAALGHEEVAYLDAVGHALETNGVPRGVRGWALPGSEGNIVAAHLDLARTICRRAERALWEMRDAGSEHEGAGPDTSRAGDEARAAASDGGDGEGDRLAAYLNRLSDVLWLVARAIGSAGTEESSRSDRG